MTIPIPVEYRRAYARGWRASARAADGTLDRADARGEPEAWYLGYHDYAAGRAKWHTLNQAPTKIERTDR